MAQGVSELHNISETCEARKWEIVCVGKLSMHKICASKRCDQQSWCLESGLKQSRFLENVLEMKQERWPFSACQLKNDERMKE